MAATERQNTAITRHDRSMVVTAGAGTGKTFVLVQKYLDLLRTKKVSVPEILALTFTDKAAAEMKERIRKELSRQSGPAWEKATEDFLVAPVQTFHSFCAQVLREFPLEAGLDPGFSVLDERTMARIHADIFDELVQRVQPEPANSGVIRLLSVFDQYTLREMLGAMYERRDQYARFFEAFGTDEAAVLSFWQEEVHRFRDAELFALAADRDFSDLVKELLGFADTYSGADDKAAEYATLIQPALAVLAGPFSPDRFSGAAAGILETPGPRGGSRKVWQGDDLARFKAARKRLAGILEQKAPLFRLTVDPADPLLSGSVSLLHDLSNVFPRYLALVEAQKSKEGGIDFSDLVLSARNLFVHRPDLVAMHFAGRYRYILVDEFQDTDPAQFDIVLALVGKPGENNDSLFIVGDPKQSIYLFRDADVTRFKAAQQIIESACNGSTVDLDTSFRSTGAVIGLSNSIFTTLFSSVKKPWEFGYQPIVPSPARAGHEGTVELMLPTKGDTSTATKQNEADMVARRIQSVVVSAPADVYEEQPDHTFIRRKARYGDIAILIEQRTNLPQYLAFLSRYGIPYYVHGGTGFYNRQEIYDLYNLLSFFLNNHNDVSLAGVLRSPCFGLSDAELFFVSQEKNATFFGKLKGFAEKTGTLSAVRAVRLLTSWQEYAGRAGLVFFIRKILWESGVYTVYGAMPDGEQVLANIEKLVAIIRAREEKGLYSLADLTSELRLAMDEEEREGEAHLDALAQNAVNIMTVHAAKGLEFPIVFVPDMGVSFRDRPETIMIGDDPRLVGIKAPDPGNNFVPAEGPVLTALREVRREKERAEKKRLLYVALTRARDHLFMSGTMPDDPEVPLPFARTRIAWVCTALGITDDAIKAGGITLEPGNGIAPFRMAIVTDPLAIPAELTGAEPELIGVPADGSGKTGTRVRPVYEPETDPDREITVSALEEELAGRRAKREPGVPKYLTDIYPGEKRGTIIHEVLRGRDAATVLEEYGEFSEQHLWQCGEIRTAFFSSDLVKRVKRSYCEVPFSISFEGKRVTGTIDRLCELEDGSWAVIDYKSAAAGPEGYAALAEEYRKSMEIYCEAARELVPGKEVATYLYFTETGEFLPLKS
ncbi:UvrD-helicase domain-containing protein [Methanoregula sp.]|uniref:UvrD-helicase domain-containing protein n=1 Tax=Methanoregula sp. TaxID=2052170 RepID=UPI0035699BDC